MDSTQNQAKTKPPPYPKRPAYFSAKFTRLLFKAGAANELGQDVVVLLVAVVSTEDCKRYAAPPTFYNGQLLALCGFRKWERLAAARQKAANAGWLNYVPPPQGQRTPGWYWVSVPPSAGVFNDTPLDENGDELGRAYRRGHADGKAGRPCEPYPAKGDCTGNPPPQTDSDTLPFADMTADTVRGNFLSSPFPLEERARTKRGQASKQTKFTVPTLEEVRAYVNENKLRVDPQAFVDFQESKGWRVGNCPMKNWQAALRTWSRRENTHGRNGHAAGPSVSELYPPLPLPRSGNHA